MARAGAEVTSIDLTENAVVYTRKYAAFEKLKVDVQEMSAEQITFPDNTFDFVLGWGFLMHTEYPEIALRELVRVTKPGGRVTLYFYYKHSITYWWHIFFMRGVLKAQLIRYRGNRIRLVSRNTDGNSFGGNAKTDVLTRKWFKQVLSGIPNLETSFEGWGPPQLIDTFPMSGLPLGKFIPEWIKILWSNRFGFGHIVHMRKT
jgi:ubiquinone/menaquinone biosynthesis C-methylase UbiE